MMEIKVKIMGESKIKLMTFHDEYTVDEYVYKNTNGIWMLW